MPVISRNFEHVQNKSGLYKLPAWYKIKCTNNAEFFVEVFWKKDRMKFNDKAIIAYQIKDQNQHL